MPQTPKPLQQISQIMASIGIPGPIAAAIEQMIAYNMDPSKMKADDDEPTEGAIAKRLLHRAHRFNTTDADLCSSLPRWHILLALVIDEDDGRRSFINSLYYTSGVPDTTVLRHLVQMEQQGLVARQPDPLDARRVVIRMTPETSARVRAIIPNFTSNLMAGMTGSPPER